MKAEMSAGGSAGLAPRTRIPGIDMLRGLVIVIMVLDHVRDYFHYSGYAYDPIDFHHTTPIVYATRWITNLCAPTFVLLAGVSAWIQHVRGKDTAVLSAFLAKRGLWLIVLELTVINFAWSFSVPMFLLLQVIWAIGWSMLGLAILVWLPRQAVLAIGAAIVLLHNLLDPIHLTGALKLPWQFLHDGGVVMGSGGPIALLGYPVLPWLGVMALGYGLGAAFLSERRDTILVQLGSVLILAFFLLRAFNIYGDPHPWAPEDTASKTVEDFFNVHKYPPSLLYLCATLGPMLLIFPWLNRLKGAPATFLLTFGAVPLMAYVAHLYVMHALAIVARAVSGQGEDGMFDTLHDIFVNPAAFAGTGFPIWATYIGWAVTVAIVYPICRWWVGVKRRRTDWWLSYL
jgi:uncharacterized membrane protein